MYGTQDASHIWQEDYSTNLEGAGYKRGISNGAVFLNEDQDSRCLVHGDDFVLVGDEEAIKHMHELLSKHYDLKMTGKIGFDEADEREAVMLNRVLRCVPESEVFEIEADQRHAEIIIDELGLTGGKSVTTPIVKKKNEEVIADAKLPAVKAEEATRYRSATMRAKYLAQDRPDLDVAAKELARHMQAPNEANFQSLKRLGRYLQGRPRAVLRYGVQKMPDYLDMVVDSDHAGCPITRKSTTGFVANFGDHVVKTGSALQSTVSLNSGESEYYALVKGAAMGLAIQALLRDWGIEVKVRISSDSSAARSFSNRRGLGKQRHVQTRFLWVQERVACKHISIVCIHTDVNHADVLTKAMSSVLQDKHLRKMGLRFLAGKSAKQKATLKAGTKA
jgi:hypothetical protein